MPNPMGEFDLIKQYFHGLSDRQGVLVGIGDDCAVVDWPGPLALSTDTLIADVHFPADVDAYSVGHRCLAVNLSDLAAMGAAPLGFTLALTLPAADTHWLTEFSAGIGDLARRFDAALVGGDTTRGPLSITIQIIGQAPVVGTLRRNAANIGDDIYVSGRLGGALAGLECIQEALLTAEQAAWKMRFLQPEPRVELGQQLVGRATAAIDISDGLLADLGHLVQASGCGAAVELEAVPLVSGLETFYGDHEALRRGACGGDEYELCFTVPPTYTQELVQIGLSCNVELTRIGQVVAGDSVRCTLHGKEFQFAGKGGYEHF